MVSNNDIIEFAVESTMDNFDLLFRSIDEMSEEDLKFLIEEIDRINFVTSELLYSTMTALYPVEVK